MSDYGDDDYDDYDNGYSDSYGQGMDSNESLDID